VVGAAGREEGTAAERAAEADALPTFRLSHPPFTTYLYPPFPRFVRCNIRFFISRKRTMKRGPPFLHPPFLSLSLALSLFQLVKEEKTSDGNEGKVNTASFQKNAERLLLPSSSSALTLPSSNVSSRLEHRAESVHHEGKGRKKGKKERTIQISQAVLPSSGTHLDPPYPSLARPSAVVESSSTPYFFPPGPLGPK
jgi:hypothetical protein